MSSEHPSIDVLEQLYAVIEARKDAPLSESYSAALLAEAPKNLHVSSQKKPPKLLLKR